jgi:glucose-1-phosphate thymidylyltransferase
VGRIELEITDLNNVYLEREPLRVANWGRGYAWFGTGTRKSLLQAAEIGAARHNAGQHHHPPQDRREFHGLPPRAG